MIRFLMKNTFRDKYSGCEGTIFYSIDNDIIELENKLTSGGYDESSYERHELVGVEVIKEYEDKK